jgi:hypothetical protein
MSCPEPGRRLSPELAEKVRLVLEFHRWSGLAEGVTEGRTIYPGRFARLRSDAFSLQDLCGEIARQLGGALPAEAETLITAGRMYRRSADYVKAGEYFLRALEAIHAAQGGKESGCA